MRDYLPALSPDLQRRHAMMVLRGWRFIDFGPGHAHLYEVRDEYGKHVTARYTLASAVDSAWCYMEDRDAQHC